LEFKLSNAYYVEKCLWLQENSIMEGSLLDIGNGALECPGVAFLALMPILSTFDDGSIPVTTDASDLLFDMYREDPVHQLALLQLIKW
jgi:hypothetical protein